MKTGLVIEGGNLRSAFSFGVLRTWADAGVDFSFTAAVGLGGLAAAYFRAGQRDALEEAYGAYFEATGELSRLAALKGERALDGPAFVEMALDAHPLDMDAFAAAPGTLRYATTRSDNGDGVFWPLERVGEAKHLRQFLRAGLIVPGAAEPVQLVERSYYSGSIAEPLPVQAALDAGCDRVVVIRTHPSDFTMPRQRLTPALALALNTVPMTKNAYLLSHLHYNRELRLLDQLQRDGRAFVVAPVIESTDLHRYGVSRSAASEFYSEGLRLGGEAVAKLTQFFAEDAR